MVSVKVTIRYQSATDQEALKLNAIRLLIKANHNDRAYRTQYFSSSTLVQHHNCFKDGFLKALGTFSTCVLAGD